MKFQVLNHGYVEFIEAWGQGTHSRYRHTTFGAPPGQVSSPEPPDYERGIIEAARQSTQGSFRGWDQDKKLLQHLYENKHETPFEFAGMVIEVQAPIFVFREWHRHRTQSYNEMSARYAALPDLYYNPDYEKTVDRTIAALDTANRQAGAATKLADKKEAAVEVSCFLRDVSQLYTKAEQVYKEALASGIPKELARVIMPVGHYSRMRASANLRNWLAFMTLRCDPKAQWEIQQFALAVADIIEKTFPNTYDLWAHSEVV